MKKNSLILDQCQKSWDLTHITFLTKTHSSYLYRAIYNGKSKVILKIFKPSSDEAKLPNSLEFFDKKYIAKLIQYSNKAALIEQAIPGKSLVEIELSDPMESAKTFTKICTSLYKTDSYKENYRRVVDLYKDFDLFLRRENKQVPDQIILKAKELFIELVYSQNNTKFLHGDLHHYNILKDKKRGWVVIDPKGIIGELEYEVGPFLRNPVDNPQSFLDENIFRERLNYICANLNLNKERVLTWLFVQLILAISYKIQNRQTLLNWTELAKRLYSMI